MTLSEAGRVTAHSEGGATPAKIGPNSLIQTVHALQEFYGQAQTFGILERANYLHLLHTTPHEMVDEQEFITLSQALFNQLGPAAAEKVLGRAGQLTGDYLLANRIPKFVQIAFKFMPVSLRLRLLLKAIGKNAWTFVGSGVYSFVLGKNPRIIVSNSILGKLQTTASEPLCSFYTGTFEKLLQTMVQTGISVEERECLANGDRRCVFSILR